MDAGTGRLAAADGWLTTTQALGLAAAGVVAQVLAMALLDHDLAMKIVAVFITFIYGVYFGFALIQGGLAEFAVETAFILVGLALAGLGLVHGAGWLAVALILHGCWDLLHHPARPVLGVRGIPRWYPPFCAAFDIPAGLATLVML
jgi:uncharacterized protein DUF6010